MLQFLLRALESGEHRISVVGVGGVTIEALAHTFIEALIAEYEAHTPLQAPAPAPETEPAPALEPVPTDDQIAAYLARKQLVAMNVAAQNAVAVGDTAGQQATALAGASYGFPKEGA
jgi:hypothetical protein